MSMTLLHIKARSPDIDGNTIPSATRHGIIVVSGPEHEAQTINATLNASSFNVKEATCDFLCQSCDGYDSIAVDPSSLSLAVGGSQPIQAIATYNNGMQFTMPVDWSSSDTAVATATVSDTVYAVGPGTATITGWALLETPWTVCETDLFTPKTLPLTCPLLTDMSADAPVTAAPTITSITPAKALVGTAPTVTINGTGFAQGATIQAGPSITVSNISVSSSTSMKATFTIQNSNDAAGSWNVTVTVNGETNNGKAFFVQIPSSLQVLSAATLPNGSGTDKGCGPDVGGSFGIRLDIKYQVLDQEAPPQGIANATMVPHETANLSPPVDGDICPSPVPTCTHTTAADGTWHDAPFGGCFTQSFSSQFTQRITMIVNGTAYAVRTNNVTVGSTGSGHGSISNGSDINKSQ